MDGDKSNIVSNFDERVAYILDACTACGKCFEICPMASAVEIDTTDSETITAGILDILKSGAGPEVSEKWATACSQTGQCISQCEYGVNPRFMLAMARQTMKRTRTPEAERRANGKANFKKLVKGVRSLTGIQLPKAEINNYSRPPKGGDGTPKILFWTGCNVWRTPHIVMHCLDILDNIGTPYEVLGGPGNCCGKVQLRTGDDDGAAKQIASSSDRFAATGAQEVVSWCPTCQMQIGETMIEGKSEDRPYDTSIFAAFLADRLDDLKKAFTHRVEKRVGLHLHGDLAGANAGALAVLSAIPGLEIVDYGPELPGYQCNSLRNNPEFRKESIDAHLDAAEKAGVDTLAVVYHSCYRVLCTRGEGRSFDVVNFVELLGKAMGIEHPPSFKRLKLLGEGDKVLDAVANMIAKNAMDADEVRAVVDAEMLGERD